jgi:RNA polymerase sigma factor (sigma-70 family)
MERGAYALSFTEEQRDGDLRHYQRAVRQFFFRRVSAHSDVDDLVQESVTRFIVASRRDEMQQPLGYLFRIARNLLIDHARRNAGSAPVMSVPDEEIQVAVRAEQEDALHLADLETALNEALDELPQNAARPSSCGVSCHGHPRHRRISGRFAPHGAKISDPLYGPSPPAVDHKRGRP